MVPLLRGGSVDRGRSAPDAFSLRPAFPLVSGQSLLPAIHALSSGPAKRDNPQTETDHELRWEPLPIMRVVAVPGTNPSVSPAPRAGPRRRADYGAGHANRAQGNRGAGGLLPG